jgi:hypothetical protein
MVDLRLKEFVYAADGQGVQSSHADGNTIGTVDGIQVEDATNARDL